MDDLRIFLSVVMQPIVSDYILVTELVSHSLGRMNKFVLQLAQLVLELRQNQKYLLSSSL